jgi:arylsulfatase A-like enzyme
MKVLVISVRGLHLGYLGCYGNSWIETPAIDGLAAEGIVFDQHFATNPEPSAARRSWRTGRWHLPALTPQSSETPAVEADLLALLRQAKVATHLIVDGSRDAPPGFDHGWDQVVVVPPRAEETPLEQTLSAAVHVMSELLSKNNWLVWVDLATLVPPWDVPEEYVSPYFEADSIADEVEDVDEEDEDDAGVQDIVPEPAAPSEPMEPFFDPQPGRVARDDGETLDRLQYSYASAVTFLDAGLDALVEEIGNLGLGDEIVFLLTSDHGFPLGEHGVIGLYRPWLHDELIHLPLLLSLPHGNDAGRRVAALTQSCDLLPTLLELFGVPVPAEVQGESLLPLARGETQQSRPHAVIGVELGDGLEFALRTPEWSLDLPLRTPEHDPPRSTQLYAKPEDRWEVNNLLQHHLDLADELERKLREHIAAANQPARVE